jgi:hypothetical protein
MENPYLEALAQYVVGLMTCQNLLLQYLIKKSTVNKTETIGGLTNQSIIDWT